MRITTARRIAQLFFFAAFVWLALVATVGTAWSQWRGWPIGWFLQLDPLVAIGTVLTTHSLHPGLAWALVTIALTLVLGRVFCGFVCPFGAIHQFVGWLGRIGRRSKDNMAANRFRSAQSFKYYLLTAMLAAASGNLLLELIRASRQSGRLALGLVAVIAMAMLWLTLRRVISSVRRAVVIGVVVVGGWFGLAATMTPSRGIAATLLTGWLDPIPLLTRSFNLALLPAADLPFERWFGSGRSYTGAVLIGTLFIGLVAANLWIPRFFCRFFCPLGALLGVLGRTALGAIGRTTAHCNQCDACDLACEGACQPRGPLHVSECLLCMNCLETCPKHAPLTYGPRQPGNEIATLGVTRRGFVTALAGGFAAVPLARLGGTRGANWSPGLIRPPGAVAEDEFLARCIKCSACMRVCPTNTLQPALMEHGWEALWTPVLNNRIGTSGCQLNCVACGHACPTGAIRPLTLAEKHGDGEFSARGPVRIGLAAVDRGRCLPWASQRPCIVCEENCPVTPKAISVSVVDENVHGGGLTLVSADGPTWRVRGAPLIAGALATGDYSCRIAGDESRFAILANTTDTITVDRPVADAEPPPAGTRLELQVRLQRPVVDPTRCIGCGVCEHECPMSGLRAIRITADNESRNPAHGVMLRAHADTPSASKL